MRQNNTKLPEAIKNGNIDAYKAYFLKYQVKTLSFARKFVTSSTAEAIVKDTFIKLWKMRDYLDPEKEEWQLLLTLLRHGIHSSITIFSAESEESQSDLQKDYIKASEKLPPKRRQVFLMSRRDGLTAAEIAKKLKISERTVEKHIELAEKDLRPERYRKNLTSPLADRDFEKMFLECEEDANPVDAKRMLNEIMSVVGREDSGRADKILKIVCIVQTAVILVLGALLILSYV